MSILGGLGIGGEDAPAPGSPEASGLSPFAAGKKLFEEGETPFDEVQRKAKGTLSTENIGNVDAQNKQAADSLGNADRAVAEQVSGAFKGLSGMAMSGAQGLVGDGASFLVGGRPPDPGKLEASLGQGLQALTSFMAPGIPVKEAINLAKRG